MPQKKPRPPEDLETGANEPGSHSALSHVELASALRHVPSNMMILSPELRVQWINDLMADAFSLDPTQSIGRHWYDLAPFMRMRDELYQRTIEGESFDFASVELPFPDGNRFFDVHYRPIRDDPGDRGQSSG